MPFGAISTYVPTMQEIHAHWTAVNAVGPGELTLEGGYDIDTLNSDITVMTNAINDVIAKENLRMTAAGDRDLKVVALRNRLRQFRAGVSAVLPNSRYIPSVPVLPPPTTSGERQREAFQDQSNLWSTINTNLPAIPGFVPPLLLAGAYTQAAHVTDLAGFTAALGTVQLTDQNAQHSREARNILMDAARERGRQYRQGAVLFLPAGHALLESLPIISPPPGSTPPPANLSGVWNVGTSLADLVWVHPDPTRVDHWEVRYHPGPKYRAAEEQAVTGGNLPLAQTAFSTIFGLVAPGSVAWFKVYAVGPFGNEKGSNAVKVIRP